jgi:hypothetical protein
MNTKLEQELLDGPCTSYWLKEQIRNLDKRDVLDAMRDAELLAKVANERWQAVERIYWQAMENR